jgi:hypothetical protein
LERDSQKAVSFPPACSVCDNCDEALSYPRASTGEIARSGKLKPQDVARSPLEAQFQLVFGTQINRNRKPQGHEVSMICFPRMAVEHVHALIERRLGGGFGQMQAGSFEKSATQFHRTGRVIWPNRKRSGTAKAPTRSGPDR